MNRFLKYLEMNLKVDDWSIGCCSSEQIWQVSDILISKHQWNEVFSQSSPHWSSTKLNDGSDYDSVKEDQIESVYPAVLCSSSYREASTLVWSGAELERYELLLKCFCLFMCLCSTELLRRTSSAATGSRTSGTLRTTSPVRLTFIFNTYVEFTWSIWTWFTSGVLRSFLDVQDKFQPWEDESSQTENQWKDLI